MHSLNPDRPLVRVENDGFMSEEISVSIEDILSGESDEDVGKLHVLSLTEFKTALGDLWEKRKSKIMLLTESVLRDEIGEGNYWENRTPKVYIMIFPTLSEMEADARAYEIAQEIGIKIIGDRFDGSKRPCIRVAGVDPKDALNEDGTIDLEKIEKVAEEGVSASHGDAPQTVDEEKRNPSKQKNSGSANTIDKNDPKAVQTDPDVPDWKKNKFDHEEHDTDWKKNKFDHEEHDTDWQKNKFDHEEMDNSDWEENLHNNESDDPADWVKMNDRPKQAHPQDDYKASMRFYPCWDREQQSLRFYRSTIYIEKNDNYLNHGLEGYSAYRCNLSLLEKDLWVLKETGKSLFEHTNKKIITPVFVPAHVTSILGQNFAQYLTVFSKLTEKLRKEYLIIEIIPMKGLNLESLSESIKILKELGCKIALTGDEEQLGKIPDSLDLDYAGYDLSILPKNKSISLEIMENTKSVLDRRGVRFYVFGLSQRPQLIQLLDINADLINGPALVKMTPKMRPSFPLAEERMRPK